MPKPTIVFFERVCPNVVVAGVPGFPCQQRVHEGAVVACVGLDPIVPGRGFWYGEYNEDTDLSIPGPAMAAALQFLRDGIAKPVLWAYSWMSRSYFSALVYEGLISPETGDLLLSSIPERQAAPIIARVQEPDAIRFPVEMGYVGGSRFSVFDSAAEPAAVYDAWRASLREAASLGHWLPEERDLWQPLLNSVCTGELLLPPGASGLLTPYGKENYHTAVVARSGYNRRSIASHIAETGQMDLQVCSYAEDEFWEKWDRKGELRDDSLSPAQPIGAYRAI